MAGWLGGCGTLRQHRGGVAGAALPQRSPGRPDGPRGAEPGPGKLGERGMAGWPWLFGGIETRNPWDFREIPRHI